MKEKRCAFYEYIFEMFIGLIFIKETSIKVLRWHAMNVSNRSRLMTLTPFLLFEFAIRKDFCQFELEFVRIYYT